MFLVSQQRARRHGFTLIELLVVIAIITILAAILFPVFARARESARKASCASNLKQIGLGIAQYHQDYDRFLTWNQSEGYNPREVLNPYIKSNQIWVCPSETNPDVRAMSSGRKVSYMLNGGLSPNRDFMGTKMRYGYKDADITRPAEIVVTHDADPAEVGWTEGNTWNGGKNTDWPHLRANGDGRESYLDPWFQRHNGTFNALFYDGHVKSVISAPTTLSDDNFIP